MKSVITTLYRISPSFQANLTFFENGTEVWNASFSELDSDKKDEKKPDYFFDPNICVFEIPIDEETECGRKKLAS